MSSTEKSSAPLFIVHVAIRVKPETVDAFRAAALANASASVKEAGVARFDVLQFADDPTRFVLAEAYRSPEAQAAHRETAHYQVWRDTVAPMMAEPRTPTKFLNVFPAADGW
ncbi:MAG TPA: antibiotic biosynthesis monooxygenase [Polyangia bacterium]|jgi:quinol monooxygenase YgiN